MAINNREYLFSINERNEPTVLSGNRAIGMYLIELITMNPGSDPLHPNMGVGIEKYRYGVDNLEELRTVVEKQINTYLPIYAGADVTLVETPDHLINIEISIDNTTYIYDSESAPIPITLQNIMEQ